METKQLKNAFLFAQAFTQKGKDASPALKNALVMYGNGYFSVISSNNEVVAQAVIENGSKAKAWEALIAPDALGLAFKQITAEHVDVDLERREIVVQAGRDVFRFVAENVLTAAQEFPVSLPDSTLARKEIVFDPAFVDELKRRVLPFVASDPARPVLESIYFVGINGKLQLWSADGFRMTMLKTELPFEGKYLVPAKMLAQVLKHRKKDEAIKMAFSDKDVLIEFGIFRAYLLLVVGEYPDLPDVLKYILADKDQVEFGLERKSLLLALRQARLFSTYELALSHDPGRDPAFLVSAEVEDKGKTERGVEVQAVVSNRLDRSTDASIYLATDFMLEFVNACTGDVKLIMTKPVNPVQCIDADCPEWVHVVMPTLPKGK